MFWQFIGAFQQIENRVFQPSFDMLQPAK